MSAPMDVPRLADLHGLPIDVVPSEEPGVVSVTSWANDGSVVTLTWDETAASVHVRWMEVDEVRLVVEREMVSKVSIRHDRGEIEFWVWLDAGGLGGQLVVRVGDRVGVVDALLRK